MSFHLDQASLRQALAGSERPLLGMWLNSGSALVAEICAGSGLDWLVVDAEHGPNTLTTVLAQLQAMHGYPVVPVVRPPRNEPALLKQYLDVGAQSLLIPLVETPEDAARAVAAAHYPPLGIRGVGAALARSSRWNRVPDYLRQADATVTVMVQLESVPAVERAAAIMAVPGVDAVFLGPSDLAASMGLLGQPEHPDVVAAVVACLTLAQEAGVPAGVNAFNPATARRYVRAGAMCVLLGADVTVLARGSEALAAFRDEPPR